MPGLAIIINPGAKEENQADLDRMVASLCHEPFYTKGTYSNSQLGIYVGWACHPGTGFDSLPVRSSDGNLLLFFYGEHLTENSPVNGDGQSVLELFQAHGMDALPRLNGWFHGVLVDQRERRITVFNDRYGMQRLYSWEGGESAILASEAKALLAIRPELRKLDHRGLGEFFSCGCVLENRSLFSGIKTLPAATVRTFSNGHPVQQSRYFGSEQWESQSKLPASEFYEAVDEALSRAVRRCLRSPLPIGMSLTGGFDTRLIMACLQSERTVLPTYTFGGMYRDCFDVKIAREVAEICRCQHEVLALDASFLQSFPSLAERTVYLSEGCLGATNAYELYLNQRVREIATVRLTGSYGSEVMRGARAFKAMPATPGLMNREFEPHLSAAAETFNTMSPGHPVSFSVFKQAPWYYSNRLSVEQSQVVVRTPYMDNDFVGLFYRRPNDSEEGRAMARRLIAAHSPALAKLPTDTGNCSFLRHHWAQFLFKADYCYKSGMPQWLERVHHLLGPLSPEPAMIGRHRFAHARVWFRKELATYIQDVLLDSRTAARPFFNHTFVKQMVAQHINGTRNYTDDIDRVLTLELTCRQFVDN